MNKKISFIPAILIIIPIVIIAGAIVLLMNLQAKDTINAISSDLKNCELKAEEEKAKLVILASEFMGKAEIELNKINNYLEEYDMGDEIKRREISNYIGNAVYYAKLTTDLDPTNPELWFRRGNIYRALTGLAGGTEEWALKCYKKALELDPSNQIYYQKIEELTK